MREIDTVLILGRLPLYLVDSVECEWCLELRETLAEAGDETLGLRAESDDLEIVREALQHGEILLFAVVVLGLIEIS